MLSLFIIHIACFSRHKKDPQYFSLSLFSFLLPVELVLHPTTSTTTRSSIAHVDVQHGLAPPQRAAPSLPSHRPARLSAARACDESIASEDAAFEGIAHCYASSLHPAHQQDARCRGSRRSPLGRGQASKCQTLHQASSKALHCSTR